MKVIEIRRCEMCQRVVLFGHDYEQHFSAGSRGGILFQTVHDCVVQLQDYMGQQDSAARMAKQNTQSKAALRTVLRADLKRISETARGMEFDSPGLAARFKLPPMTDQRLVAAARAFLTDAEPLKADFIKNEMPADFLDQLRRHLADFEAAVEAQSRGTERRVSASAGISDVLQRAVRAVQQLNPIVRNKLANDPAALAAWDSARHIESAPKHAKKPANTPATPVPA